MSGEPTCRWLVLRNELHDFCGRPAKFTTKYPDGTGYLCEQHAQYATHTGLTIHLLEDR